MEGGDILISCEIIIKDKPTTLNREITASCSGKRNRTKKQVVPSEDDMEGNG